MSEDTASAIACIATVLLAALLIFAGGLFLGENRGVTFERREWLAGRERSNAGQCEAWNPPQRPGDAGWWSKCQ